MIQIIVENETIPQVNTHFSFFVYSFVGNRQVYIGVEEEFYVVINSKVELQLIVARTFM